MLKLLPRNVIEFFCEPENFGAIPAPVPAGKHVPEWFKRIPTHTSERDQFGGKAMSAKKCVPLIDAMTLGYIIPLAADVNVRTNRDCSLIEAAETPFGEVIQFHSGAQLGGAGGPTKGGPAIKFINQWVVKTAPGWSTLFIPPINTGEKRFTCLGGLVDTDRYPKLVNFPALWHTPDYDGVVEAGTPLVVAIPVQRSRMAASPVVRAMTDRERREIQRIERAQDSRAHVYSKELRCPR